jgi:hypothetical protein
MAILLLPGSSPLWTAARFQLNYSSRQSQKLCYDRRSVGQSVLVSSPHLGLKTRFFCCLTVAGLLIWGTLSNERTDLFLQRTIYLHFTCYDMNVCTIYTMLLSVQAQSSSLWPIFSSFRHWTVMVILFHEILDNFCNGHCFLLLWHSTTELRMSILQ